MFSVRFFRLGFEDSETFIFNGVFLGSTGFWFSHIRCFVDPVILSKNSRIYDLLLKPTELNSSRTQRETVEDSFKN